MRKSARTSIRIVAETLDEAIATMAKEERAEQRGASRMQHMHITNEKSGDIITRNVVLKKVELQQHRSDEIHASTLIKHLALFYIPRLKGTKRVRDYACCDLLRK